MNNYSIPPDDKILGILLSGYNFRDNCNDIFNTYLTYIKSEDGILRLISLYFFVIVLGKTYSLYDPKITDKGNKTQIKDSKHSFNGIKYTKSKDNLLIFTIDSLGAFFRLYHESVKKRKEKFYEETDYDAEPKIKADNAVDIHKLQFIQKYKEIFDYAFKTKPKVSLSESILEKVNQEGSLHSFIMYSLRAMRTYKNCQENETKVVSDNTSDNPIDIIELLLGETLNETFEHLLLSNVQKINVLYCTIRVLYCTIRELHKNNHTAYNLCDYLICNITMISHAAQYVAPAGGDDNALAYITSSYLTALSFKKQKLFIKSIDEMKNAQHYNQILKDIVPQEKMQDVLNALSDETIDHLRDNYPNFDYAIMAAAIKTDLRERSILFTPTEYMSITDISDQTLPKREIGTSSIVSAFSDITLQPTY